MNIGILGTGMVGDSIGAKLVQLGHRVKMGSRTATNEKAVAWVKRNGGNASNGTFADAAKFGELLFNCTNGMATLEALKLAGMDNLNDKVLVDISNPLDFSNGMPPLLFISNTDSLGEQIQRTCPNTKVVKALNTLNATLMTNPKSLANGDHDVFICGDDAIAKKTVTSILTSFGWNARNIHDLGDITNSRGTEMVLPLWVRLMGKFQSPAFQFKIVK